MSKLTGKSTTGFLPICLYPDENVDALMEEALLNDDFYKSIIETSEFQRLRHISFLGAIDYVKTTKKKNRYQHSIDVAKLGLYISIKRNYDKETTDHIIAAALLHDIGHAPLSHSIEPSFQSKFGINHHIAGRQVILGKAEKNELNKLLTNRLDLSTVLSLIELKSKEHFSDIFSSKINIDTIDGIHKSLLSTNNQSYIYDKYMVVESSLYENDEVNVKCLDDFWKAKDFVYNNIINSGIGAIADHISKDYFEENLSKLNEGHFYKNENSLIAGQKPLFKNFSKKIDSIKIVFPSIPDANFKKVNITTTDRKYIINIEANSSDYASREEFIDNRYSAEKRKIQKNIFFAETTDNINQVEMNYGIHNKKRLLRK